MDLAVFCDTLCAMEPPCEIVELSCSLPLHRVYCNTWNMEWNGMEQNGFVYFIIALVIIANQANHML